MLRLVNHGGKGIANWDVLVVPNSGIDKNQAN